MRSRDLLPLLFALVLTAGATAQIVGLELADAKVEKRLRKWTLVKLGRPMVCGEVLSGLEVDLGASPPRVSKPRDVRRIVLLVPDPADPEKKLDRIGRGGERVVVARSRRLVGDARDVGPDGYHLLYPYESCAGLREEYLRKLARVEQLERELGASEAGTPGWFAVERRLLLHLDGLVAWLRSTLFPQAARKLERRYRSWLAKARADASKSRLADAQGSLAPYEPPAELLRSTEEIGAKIAWHGMRTRHLRVVAHGGVPDAVIERGLLLGERIVEGFRSELIDPFLGPDDVDPVIEDVFEEFFLCPEETRLMVHFFESYYGGSLGPPDRERKIALEGHAARGIDVDFLEFWRYGSRTDFDGIVAHRLGHALADIAFNRNLRRAPAWIGEGFGLWASYEYIARNTVTCHEFSVRRYAREEREGVKVVEVSRRAAFNALAIDDGPPLTRLMRMKLVEMEPPALAKSWSVVDFLVSEHRAKVMPFLTAVCDESGDERTDLEALRPRAEEIFAVEPGRDVYAVLDAQWRECASRAGGK